MGFIESGAAAGKTKEIRGTSYMGQVKLYHVEKFKTALLEVTDDPIVGTLFHDGGS